jgi:hypothetical protein
VELLLGAAVALIALCALWILAPQFGTPGAAPRNQGLSALQTIFGLLGIVLIMAWYVVEQPDAARLKFEQSVTGARLGDGRALVMIEVSISNVGGHADHFKTLPYKIFVQRVAPLPKDIEAVAAPTSDGTGRVWRADNWETLAYRAVGSAASETYPNWERCDGVKPDCEDGLETVIEPGENENLYFAATVPCDRALRVAVSSRFQRPRGFREALHSGHPQWWIKQSFLDLTDVCKSETSAKGARK